MQAYHEYAGNLMNAPGSSDSEEPEYDYQHLIDSHPFHGNPHVLGYEQNAEEEKKQQEEEEARDRSEHLDEACVSRFYVDQNWQKNELEMTDPEMVDFVLSVGGIEKEDLGVWDHYGHRDVLNRKVFLVSSGDVGLKGTVDSKLKRVAEEYTGKIFI